MTREPSIAPVGHEPVSGLFYEVVGRGGAAYPHPLLFIHGGGGNGAQWRTSFDGREGWADLLASDGFECWLTDWVGTGRSGYRDPLCLDYDAVVDGYIRLLRDVVGRPVAILPHSMGGAITWRLIEALPHLVAGVVGIACAYPANIQAPSQVTKDDGTTIELTFADTGVKFVVDRTTAYTYGDAYLYNQAGLGTSPAFDENWMPALRSSLGWMSPTMLLQRVGVLPGMPVIADTSGFSGKRVRLLAGDHDPAHTLELESKTAATLTAWGADAQVVWLPDRGVHGSSHFLPQDANYLAVLDVVVSQLQEITA